MKAAQRPEGYWHIVSRHFLRNRIAVAGLVIVLFLFIIAALADRIANDGCLVNFGAFAAKIAVLDLFLCVVPISTGVGH